MLRGEPGQPFLGLVGRAVVDVDDLVRISSDALLEQGGGAPVQVVARVEHGNDHMTFIGPCGCGREQEGRDPRSLDRAVTGEWPRGGSGASQTSCPARDSISPIGVEAPGRTRDVARDGNSDGASSVGRGWASRTVSSATTGWSAMLAARPGSAGSRPAGWTASCGSRRGGLAIRPEVLGQPLLAIADLQLQPAVAPVSRTGIRLRRSPQPSTSVCLQSSWVRPAAGAARCRGSCRRTRPRRSRAAMVSRRLRCSDRC